MKRRTITLGRIIRAGCINFVRNASLAIAAMAVMVVTLTIILFSLVTNATFTNTIAQITDQINVSVFLTDSTTDAQARQFAADIKKQPAVAKVEYLDKQKALESYIAQNHDNPSLLAAATEALNPIPATIHVYPRDLNEVQTIKDFLVKPDNQKLQTADSPSYKGDRKEASDNITHTTNILQRMGIAAVILFTIISALIIFNTIQMAIFNRRDEIQIMRLLGASTNYIRGPFVVESAIYGILSALISILIINSTFTISSGALQASSLGLLDIGFASEYFTDHFLWFLTLQLLIGMIIGTASSVIATRRYLKFKTK